MPRMIELIRSSTASSHVMQTAARGALSVPPAEMIEILVYLATQTKIFAERARLTLAGWDETSSRAAAANPQTSKEVLAYMVTPGNLRPALLPALLENPAVSEDSLAGLAASASRLIVDTLLKSERVMHSPKILTSLSSNPHLIPAQAAAIKERLSSLTPLVTADPKPITPASIEAASPEHAYPQPPKQALGPDAAADDTHEETLAAYLNEHAAEISAETATPFQPIGGVHEDLIPRSEEPHHADAAHADASPATVAADAAHGAAAAPKRAATKKVYLSAEEQRGSALQKIGKLDIKGRIALAMKGTKEERSLLIRDGTKLVALSVLESPKVTDAEIEKFATQKNVLEAVLRGISMHRRFIKQYSIMRNLVFNPRTPIDVSLGLIKNLLIGDLRNLTGNKEVSETVRKLAMRLFRQKLDVTKKD